MQTQSVTDVVPGVPKTLIVTSEAFQNGKRIPREHTCQGDDASPPLAVENVPEEAAALALIVEDPDAPGGIFTHWTAWDLEPGAALPQGADLSSMGGREGLNDFGNVGYGGPCPPSGTHRYFFRVFALREPLALRDGARVDEVRRALRDRVLAWGELMGTYTK